MKAAISVRCADVRRCTTTDFDGHAIASEVLHADQSLLEGSPRLDNVVVVGVNVGIDWYADHKIRMRDIRQMPRERVVVEQASVREHVQRCARKP